MKFKPGTYKTQELIDLGLLQIGDGYRAKNSELSENGIPFARAGNINNGFLFNDVDRFPFENLNKVKDKRSRPFDSVFTSKGSVGRIAYVKKETEEFVYSPQLCYWRSLNFEIIDPRFLNYWMNGSEFNHQIDYLKGQTDMADYVSLRDQRKIMISIPDMNDQKQIGYILSSIVDKIELNQQTNQTLEQISQAIFNSWFVDFEPVKAKDHIRKLGGNSGQIEGAAQAIIAGVVNLEDILNVSNLVDLDGMIKTKLGEKLGSLTKEQQNQLEKTSKLFSVRLEESELGLIPQGWNASEIGKEVNIVGGGTPRTKNKEFWENGDIHWTTPRDLSKLSDKILLETDRKITEKGLSKISSGLLPVDTVLLSSRAPVGYLALTKIPVAINQGYIAMKCEKDVSPVFVLQWANSVMDEIKQRASGTTFAEISKKNFRLIPILVPPNALVDGFSLFSNDIYDRISKNISESDTLNNLRDTLLPKLLSGEIKV